MDLTQLRKEFEDLQRKIVAVRHGISLIYYDGETVAPPGTADNRMKSLEILNDEMYNLKFGERTMELMELLWENESELNQLERRALELLRRETVRERNVPQDLYVEYKNLVIMAQDAWHKANENSDYEILKPYLERIFDTSIEFSNYCNPDLDPYEYYLDNYEPGIGLETYDQVFDMIKREIPPLLQAIMEKPQPDDSCLKGDFSAEKQKELSLYIMDLLGINMGRVALATAEHPFSTSIGSHFDERIVTRFSRKDFTFSLFTMLYECGNVLYEMGQDDNVAYTFIDASASLGILESQSRFYEHVVGRGRAFIEFIYPKLLELFPESLGDYHAEDLYFAVNKVEPGPIRIGSDEVSNNLHVLVRYELEKALMNKSLSVNDLPDAWAENYKKYMGVEIKSPVEGVLQDIHWPHGAIGYFPSGVLGNIYAALMAERMQQDINFDECLREGNYKLINLWNRENVWRRAGLYDTNTVIEQYVGMTISGEPYIKYLKDKYMAIYKL